MRTRLRAVLAANLERYRQNIQDPDVARAATSRIRAETLVSSLIEENGKSSSATGSFWVASFEATSDAVETALRIRDRLADEDLPPLGFACDVGEVIEAGAGVFGPAVETAAELAAGLEPGAIALTKVARAALNATLRPSFDADRRLASRGVWILPAGAAKEVEDGRRKLSIASNAPGLAEEWQASLATAIAGDLLRELDSAPWLAPTLKPRAGDTDFSLTVNLKREGPSLRLNAELSDEFAKVIWSDEVEGDLSDPITWRRQAVHQISNAAFEAISAHETKRIERTDASEMGAVDCIAAAFFCCRGFSPDGNDLGLEFAARAVERAPDFAEAYATALSLYFAATARGGGRTIPRLATSYRLWRAKGADVTVSNPHLDANLAIADYRENLDPDALKDALDRAIGRDPLNVSLLAISSFAYVWMGAAGSVLDFAERGLRIGPRHPLWPVLCAATGRALIMVGQNQAAIDLAKKGLEIAPDYGALHDNVCSGSAHLGRLGEARASLYHSNDWYDGEQTIQHRMRRAGYLDTPTTLRFFEGLRLAGLRER